MSERRGRTHDDPALNLPDIQPYLARPIAGYNRSGRLHRHSRGCTQMKKQALYSASIVGVSRQGGMD